MKLLVIGATGGTGQHIVTSALAAGHEVTALARTPSKITSEHERLRIVAGDVLNLADVVTATKGQDGVLSALGAPHGQPPGTLISDGTRNLVVAMQQNGVKRFVLESGLMVGDGKAMNLFKRMLVGVFRMMNRALYHDKVRAEAIVTASDLDWIIVRPANLKHRPGRGAYRVGPSLDVNVVSGFAHADVADFMVKAASTNAHLRQIVDITD